MIQPGCKYSATDAYRYGFNGKENDNEVSGEGNKLDFGDRIYDSRLSRWFVTDPIFKSHLSPYQFAKNNPLIFFDPDGGDEIHFIISTTNYQTPFGTSTKKEITFYIVPKDGHHEFFAEKVTKTMVGTLKDDKDGFAAGIVFKEDDYIWSTKSIEGETTQFYPQLNSKGYSTHSTGITRGAFGIFKDADHTSLAKLGSSDLFDYLNRTRPNEGWDQFDFLKTFTKAKEFISEAVVADGLVRIGTGLLRIRIGGSTTIGKHALGPGVLGDMTEAMAARSLILEEASIEGAHFFSRHGAQTSLSSQYTRAISGLTPDGVVLTEVNASRFLSHKAQGNALAKAKEIYSQTGKSSFSFQMDEVIGEGYLKGGGTGSFKTTNQVQAVFKDGM